MALDAQVAALLERMKANGDKVVQDMTVFEARQTGWDFLDWQGEPQDVAKIEHRFVSTPTADIPVRIYYPRVAQRSPGRQGSSDAPLPSLVYFHGSGWVVNNIEICDPAARALCNGTGCVVIAVNYQKAPEHKFPVAVDDAWAATTWVARHARELGLDPARIGVIGDSAGGNLAAVTAIHARDAGGPALACQVLIYPVTDTDVDKASYHKNAAGYFLERATMQWFFAHYLSHPSQGQDPRVSPLLAHDLSRLPPSLVITAEYDPLRDDGYGYAQKLAAAGTPTTYKEYAGATHGIFWMQGVLEISIALHADIAKWIRGIMFGQ